MLLKLDKPLYLAAKPIEQLYDYNCGPTALAIALNYQYGLSLTQKQVIVASGVTRDGASEHHFIKALKVMGFKYEESGKGTLQKLVDFLSQNITPIVHIVDIDGGGHYVVVIGLDDENVTVADPMDGTEKRFGIPYFLGVWKEEAIENSTAWYIAVTGTTVDRIESVINVYKNIRKKLQKAKS